MGEPHDFTPLHRIETLIPASDLQARVRELGAQISRDFAGQEVLLVGVLKGAFMFLADLARAIDNLVVVDFLGVSSYGSSTTTTGVVRITRDLTWPITDRNVIVVEDIIDTGLTMNYLLEYLGTRHPRALKVCTLLHKPARTRVQTSIDYTGFTIDDHFVIGYGLDYDGRYRNLPFVGVCTEIPE
jgi:hypoxanthine phosphoribosyltransferase